MYLGKTESKHYSRFWCLFLCVCSLSISANAQVSVQLPSTSANVARDRIVTPERFECENALGGKAQVEYGVAASNSQNNNNFQATPPTGGNNVTVYGKIVIPIGGPKSRIDCNRLFELEVRKRELEIRLLEMQTNPDNFKATPVPTE